MISTQEALRLVLEHTPRLEAVEAPVPEAVGCVLAEPVASDMDLPPFDKSAMDGYAARASDLADLPAELEVVEELAAGSVPTRPVEPGACARIMTGAPVPEGADLVVPVEDTEPAGTGRVRVLRAGPAGRNVCLRGEDVRRGETVLEAGRRIRPAEAGLLASVGRERVRVVRRPRVAVLATGDELVPVSATPGPGEIRNANSWSLSACCRQAGVPCDDLGVARDVESDLRGRLTEGLARDLLLVSGGVSVGKWDLVPGLFEALGVHVHFATVRQKPGKPTVFATHGRGVVFGLPGNPVSTLVVFHLYVLPAIRTMMGEASPAPATVPAALAEPVTVRGDRTSHLPATLRRSGDGWTVRPAPTHGSADLVAFCRADALVSLAPGDHAEGAVVEAVPMDHPLTNVRG